MTTDEKELGQLAGLLYFIVVAAGIFSLAYVPSKTIVAGDFQATAAAIAASEPLFRFGIAGFMVMQAAFLVLPLALFRLFRTVDLPASVLMVSLAAVSVPLGLASLANKLDALSLLTDPYFAQSLAPERLLAAAKASLDAYGHGLLVTRLFWGLWLFPFGYLVLKSRMLPRFLGVLLVLGGLGYLINVFGELLVPQYSGLRVSGYIGLPAAAGEIGTCLWLLLAGARRPGNRADTAAT